jgi:hypothetical protein
MTRPSFKSALSLVIGLSMAIVAGGASADARAPAAADAGNAASFKRAHSEDHSMHAAICVGRGANETLLIGTSNRTIVQVEPRSGQVLTTLSVPTLPMHIAADATTIYFGGWLGRYELATQALVSFAFSDAFTGAAALAISPSGTVFASNLYYFRPDTGCGTCSTVVAYPNPTGMNPVGNLYFYYGYVRPLAGGEGVLSGQQIAFTDEAKLLVTSAAGDGIFVSDTPLMEIPGAPRDINFTALVTDDSHTTLRFARRGGQRLLVLHTTGSLDEHDLATGRLVRPVLQAGTLDPVDLVVGHDNTVYVLEKSGQVRVFSAHGRESGRITLPATAGQAVSLALCCGAPPHGQHRR